MATPQSVQGAAEWRSSPRAWLHSIPTRLSMQRGAASLCGDPLCVQSSTVWRPSPCAWLPNAVILSVCMAPPVVTLSVCMAPQCGDALWVQGSTVWRPSLCPGRHRVQTLTAQSAAAAP